ncbi:unnamed protein product [Staurois parvus]|uniref:Uncharacterized protein n=1 Tax=Staurois parvus TaxID=386267 RepID=A0ABN9EZT2_9NEOB|nr:unnamed protein product [Staurois parvus]
MDGLAFQEEMGEMAGKEKRVKRAMQVCEEKQDHWDLLVRRVIKERVEKEDLMVHMGTKGKLGLMDLLDLRVIKAQEETWENLVCASAEILCLNLLFQLGSPPAIHKKDFQSYLTK